MIPTHYTGCLFVACDPGQILIAVTVCLFPASPVPVPRTRLHGSVSDSPTVKAVSTSPLSGHVAVSPPVSRSMSSLTFDLFLVCKLDTCRWHAVIIIGCDGGVVLIIV